MFGLQRNEARRVGNKKPTSRATSLAANLSFLQFRLEQHIIATIYLDSAFSFNSELINIFLLFVFVLVSNQEGEFVILKESSLAFN